MSSHTTPNLHSLEQNNEVSRTSVGADPNSQQQRPKGRGFARPYVGWGTGGKLEVTLNKDNQPIGNTAGPLQSQLDIFARNATLAPLTFTDWRAPELYPYKERIWADFKIESVELMLLLLYCRCLVVNILICRKIQPHQMFISIIV
ncbi:uncharacterized protein LOC131306859 [Rhododendron vialii]|uniref:uncharacterized protein LOC131306859 n=1 Tax=Rhododendron vialii TaxID=182163 RepID=UPI00265F7031|nr:uncharacterized protein LOC131306859 [Rhododendron vialii]